MDFCEVLLCVLVVVGCFSVCGSRAGRGGGAAPGRRAAGRGPRGAPAPPVAAGRPELPTTPRVKVQVGVLPLSSYGAHYLARTRGYFDAVGLDVEFTSG